MAIRIDLPTTEEKMRSLKVGDEVRLFGHVITARDAAGNSDSTQASISVWDSFWCFG